MGKNIQTISRAGVLIVQPTGRLDLTLGYELWRVCAPDQRQYHGYVFDLGGISDLRDSGIAWLLMMERWVANIGIRFTITNVRPEFLPRIQEAGINVEGAGPPLVAQDPVRPKLAAGQSR